MRHLLIGCCLCLSVLVGISRSSAQQSDAGLPQEREPITAENADQVQLLATVGNGWGYDGVDWSPDGKSLAVGSFGGPVIYDTAHFDAPPRPLTDSNSGDIDQVHFTADGKQLWTEEYAYQTPKVWDLRAGTSEPIVPKHPWISDLDVSPNGQWNVIRQFSFSPSDDAFTLYEASNKKVIATVNGLWLGFNNNNDMLYFTQDRKQLLKQSPGLNQSLTLKTFTEDVYAAALSPDRNLVASIVGKELSLFDARSGEQKASANSPQQYNLKFSKDSSHLLTYTFASLGDEVDIWSISELLEKQAATQFVMLPKTTLWVRDAVFSPDATRVAVTTCGFTDFGGCSVESELRIWNLTTSTSFPETYLHLNEVGPRLDRNMHQLSYQGHLWDLTNGRSNALTDDALLWDTSSDVSWGYSMPGYDYGQELDSFMRTCAYNQVACMNNYQLWNLVLKEPAGLFASVFTPIFSPDNKSMAIDSGRATLIIDLATRKTRQTLWHGEPINHGSFSLNGRYFVGLATQGEQNIARIWNIDSGLLTFQMSIPAPNRPYQASYRLSPSGEFVYFWDKNHIYVWDINSEQMNRTIDLPVAGRPSDVQEFSSSHMFIVTWSNKVGIFDMHAGKFKFVDDGTKENRSDSIQISAIQPQGNTYAVAAFRTLQMRSTADDKLLMHSENSDDAATYENLTFSPDGTLLIASYGSGLVTSYTEVWDVAQQKRLLKLAGVDGKFVTDDLIMTEDRGFVRFWGIPKAS